MDDSYYTLVAEQYRHRGSDFTTLMQTILSVAQDIGLDQALALLERCAVEKRLAWLDEHLPMLERSDNPVRDGFRLFYEVYLGVSVPQDGAIIEQTDTRIVARWWNACPLLDVCVKMGLDTREICQKTYEKPVQVFLSRIDPRLKFTRSYASIRPHAPYCEEVISLTE